MLLFHVHALQINFIFFDTIYFRLSITYLRSISTQGSNFGSVLYDSSLSRAAHTICLMSAGCILALDLLALMHELYSLRSSQNI